MRYAWLWFSTVDVQVTGKGEELVVRINIEELEKKANQMILANMVASYRFPPAESSFANRYIQQRARTRRNDSFYENRIHASTKACAIKTLIESETYPPKKDDPKKSPPPVIELPPQ